MVLDMLQYILNVTPDETVRFGTKTGTTYYVLEASAKGHTTSAFHSTVAQPSTMHSFQSGNRQPD